MQFLVVVLKNIAGLSAITTQGTILHLQASPDLTLNVNALNTEENVAILEVVRIDSCRIPKTDVKLRCGLEFRSWLNKGCINSDG